MPTHNLIHKKTPLAEPETPSQPTQADYLFSPGTHTEATIHQLFSIQEWSAVSIWGYERKKARVGDWLTIIDPTESGGYPDIHNTVKVRLGSLIPHDGWCPYGPDWTTFIALNRNTGKIMAVHVPCDMVDEEDEVTREKDITQQPGITKEEAERCIKRFLERLTRTEGTTGAQTPKLVEYK
ncbi:hypothetical protein H0H92_005802 [Tricholoma furcatifolium]|nr:hypothetical protein H0H92_005802 [Tricholoma furcatifolium]